MEIYDSREGEIPNNNEYVVARYTGGNWHDSDDQEGCVWKVVKFIRGLSDDERAALPDSNPKKKKYGKEDEHGNNLKPYCWQEFGPGCIFGQDIDLWFRLPRGLKNDES